MSDSEDDPEVIRANAEAKALEIEARSKLHPAAQFLYTLGDQLRGVLGQIGCFLIIVLLILAFFAPGVLASLFGGG